MVPPSQSKSGFFSRYSLVPKKDGSLRPILDLRHLNHSLIRQKFRMTTLILVQMDAALFPLKQTGIRILNYLDDWFVLAQSEEWTHYGLNKVCHW